MSYEEVKNVSGESRSEYLRKFLPIANNIDEVCTNVEFVSSLLERKDLKAVSVKKTVSDGVTGDCVILELQLSQNQKYDNLLCICIFSYT